MWLQRPLKLEEIKDGSRTNHQRWGDRNLLQIETWNKSQSQIFHHVFHVVCVHLRFVWLCSGLPRQNPWLGKCIQSRWKQCSPWAAAQLHLDSGLCESQACSPHCLDSYLCNCLPSQGGALAELATALPATHSKTGDMLQWRLWSVGAFSSLPREMRLLLCQLDLHSGSKCCLSGVPLDVLSEQGTAGLLTCVTGPGAVAQQHRSSSQEGLDNAVWD